jgi:hypothetical protein
MEALRRGTLHAAVTATTTTMKVISRGEIPLRDFAVNACKNLIGASPA